MKTTYLYGAMALGLLFTACKSDDLTIPDSNYVAEADQTFYVAMNIKGDIPGTRGSLNDGTPIDGDVDFAIGTENAINNAYFVFYDKDGRMVGDIIPTELTDDMIQTNPEGETVEKHYRSVVPVSIRKGEMIPIQVICYINPISPAALQNPLNVIQTVTREDIKSNDYFAMSNSVYYPSGSEVENFDGKFGISTEKPLIAVPIPDGFLKTSESDAETAAKDNECVNIYVERYASKLKFSADQKKINSYTAGTRLYNTDEENPDEYGTYTRKDVILNFKPDYWALNAQANTTYVIKSFRTESPEGQIMADNYSYTALNNLINIEDPSIYSEFAIAKNPNDVAEKYEKMDAEGWWSWNNPAYHRSYWSISPAYFQAEYPEVASDLEDMRNEGKTLNQTFLTYNQIAATGSKVGFEANDATPQYFRETTVGAKALASRNPAAATPSVLYIGHYELTIGDGAPINLSNGETGFYTYLKGAVNDASITDDREYIYFDNEKSANKKNNLSVKSVVEGGSSMLMRFLAQSTLIYKLDENGNYVRYDSKKPEDVATLITYLTVDEISKKVKEEAVIKGETGTGDSSIAGDTPKELKIQANARSLQFYKAPGSDVNMYIATGDGYKKIIADKKTNGEPATPTAEQITLTQANVALMQQIGFAYYYFGGNAYFNIPVKHLGWYRKGNPNRYNADGDLIESSKIDWKLVRAGDFGMVRNHSYTINVESISGLASGIGGPNVEIVPPAVTDDYWVAYTVRILKWAVVPTQNVKL